MAHASLSWLVTDPKLFVSRFLIPLLTLLANMSSGCNANTAVTLSFVALLFLNHFVGVGETSCFSGGIASGPDVWSEIESLTLDTLFWGALSSYVFSIKPCESCVKNSLASFQVVEEVQPCTRRKESTTVMPTSLCSGEALGVYQLASSTCGCTEALQPKKRLWK